MAASILGTSPVSAPVWERGRKGESERVREGERESGRVGEWDCGRVGEGEGVPLPVGLSVTRERGREEVCVREGGNQRGGERNMQWKIMNRDIP